MNINELHDMWKQDSVIVQSKLDEESLRTIRLHAKYLELLSAARGALTASKKKLAVLRHDKKRWLTGRMTKEEMDSKKWDYNPFPGSSRPLRPEIEEYISVDKDVIALEAQCAELQLMTDALLEMVNNLNWRHQTIRNTIDWAKFTSGG